MTATPPTTAGGVTVTPATMAAMWDGAKNLLDLGGLPLVDGGVTARGRVWRSAAPDSMTRGGWTAARAAGVTTVVDLRNDMERDGPVVWPASSCGIDVVHAPTENPEDTDFLAECGPWLDHPRSWKPNLRRYPDKFVRVFDAVAAAEGGVLVHCAGGRDRTGLIASMLLSLAGVDEEAIADHYEAGFRGAGEHAAHGFGYDPSTGEPDARSSSSGSRRRTSRCTCWRLASRRTASGTCAACCCENEPMPEPYDVPITDESIRLGQFLKLANLVESGSEAKPLIAAGMVRVNDEVETRRGRQLVKGDVVQLAAQAARVADGGTAKGDNLPW